MVWQCVGEPVLALPHSTGAVETAVPQHRSCGEHGAKTVEYAISVAALEWFDLICYIAKPVSEDQIHVSTILIIKGYSHLR